MKVKLPKIAETLIQASNEKDVGKYLSCFSESAVYTDAGENETVAGKEAIEHNFREMKYDVHAEPFQVEENADTITVKVKASGNFQGSPLNFSYRMKLEAGLIQDLRVDLLRDLLPDRIGKS